MRVRTTQKPAIVTNSNAKRLLDEERRAIVNWLSPLNFFKKQKDVFSSRQEGTGEWLLESKDFKDWVSDTGKTLWCPGIRLTYPNNRLRLKFY
jgi:hypothetical protein